jgi:hypothetical protein
MARAKMSWAFLICPTSSNAFAVQGPIDSNTVIHCFALFRPQQQKPALVVIDNSTGP